MYVFSHDGCSSHALMNEQSLKKILRKSCATDILNTNFFKIKKHCLLD